MTKTATEHHQQAAEHLRRAAEHHTHAAEHHEQGDHPAATLHANLERSTAHSHG